MGRIFLETTALIKLYHNEQGSSKLDDLIKPTDSLTISALARLEFISAIYSLIRRNALTESVAKKQLQLFHEDMSNFHIIKYDYHIFTIAMNLLETYGTKMDISAREAIHVASAKPLLKLGLDYFLSSNTTLIKLAKLEGFKTINLLD
ncbi:MAG: type II toxin-antitoxin system VapC family toxin [Candidatus Coatesbacteria bacterium]|nr:type II toxin-antitoxin system VapC family toxin [Candidatus Coatesbacteria bacterium]